MDFIQGTLVSLFTIVVIFIVVPIAILHLLGMKKAAAIVQHSVIKGADAIFSKTWPFLVNWAVFLGWLLIWWPLCSVLRWGFWQIRVAIANSAHEHPPLRPAPLSEPHFIDHFHGHDGGGGGHGGGNGRGGGHH